MAALIYIHGFLSSPKSAKAQEVKAWLSKNRPDITCHIPYLTAYPGQTRDRLEILVEQLLPDPLYLMGSSMGGFWATYLAEKYNLKAVLINPAADPLRVLPNYLNVRLQNYHTDESYVLTEQHVEELRAGVVEVKRRSNYWLMVQTGDETLDYRLAVEKYHGCKQLVEEGGDHGFQNFERWIEPSINFFEN